MEPEELLAEIILRDGSKIRMSRQEGVVRACHQDDCFALPDASALKALELFSLLDSLGRETLLPPEEEPQDGPD